MSTQTKTRFSFESMKPVDLAEQQQVEGGWVAGVAAAALIGLTLYGGYHAGKRAVGAVRRYMNRSK